MKAINNAPEQRSRLDLKGLADRVRQDRRGSRGGSDGDAIRRAVGDVDSLHEAAQLAEAQEVAAESIFDQMTSARTRRTTEDSTSTASPGRPLDIRGAPIEEEYGAEDRDEQQEQEFLQRSLSRMPSMDSFEDLRNPKPYVSRMLSSRGKAGDPPALFCNDKALLLAGVLATAGCFILFCFIVAVKVIWMSEVEFGLQESGAA